MALKIGFIGTGVMGEAIINGITRAGSIAPSDIFVYDVDHAKLIIMVDNYAVRACSTLEELVSDVDIVLLAVKPTVCQGVLERIADIVAKKAVVSIVAGWNSAKFGKYLRESTRLLCVMPNIPAVSGAGMSVLSANHSLTKDEFAFAKSIFDSFGETETIDERYFDVVTGISGSGPAYVFMFVEAMMNAGVYNGLPAKTARKLAIQTVLGAATMLKATDRHPADMRDAVCTPGGTTIEAVYDLESHGFNGTVMSAVDRCTKKYRQMVNG